MSACIVLILHSLVVTGRNPNVGSILVSTLTVFFLVGIGDSEAPVDIDIDGSFALVLVSPVKAPLSKLSTR